MQNKIYDFFISYNKEDIAFAEILVNAIKNNDLSCWWQKENSKQEYEKEIVEAIKNSVVLIVLLSPQSALSKWVGREILEGLRQYSLNEIKILPIVVKPLNKADQDYFNHILGDFNWLYFENFHGEKEIVEAISNQVNVRLKQKSANSIYSAQEEKEKERLEKQNNLYNMYVCPHLDALFEKLQQPNILDIGCSDAANIMFRLAGKEYQHLLCVDKDSEKIEEAKVHFTNEKVSFMEADITRRDFEQKLNNYLGQNRLEGFDLIHISAVLLHIKNPQGLLKMLYRVLNKGGYIFIQDEDDGLNMAYQDSSDEPSFFDDCFYIWKQSKESGDRFMARKIPIYLRNVGYQNIEMKSSIISSIDFNGAYKEDLWDMYFNADYWVVDSPDYFDKRDAYEKSLEYTKQHSKMKKRFMKDKIFITLGVLVFVAQK